MWSCPSGPCTLPGARCPAGPWALSEDVVKQALGCCLMSTRLQKHPFLWFLDIMQGTFPV